ncbi:hypothetical protein BGZ47_000191 [Haplosporangium gracile]|nr:hypothetical protein BGZ47_000191 [Haplosporangium gracile]
METALDRSKDMPELIFMVASLLNHKDISNFRLTCQKCHDICQHFHYRDARLTDRWTKEGLQTLANSASLIRSLETSERDLAAEDTLKALVHNLPAPLETFSLLFETFEGQGLPSSDEEDDDEEVCLVNTVSALLGPIAERKESPRRLADWGLVIAFGDIEADVVVPLLELLPELVSMGVPSIGFQAPIHTFDVATRISKACPKLKHLRMLHTHTDKEGTMALAFLHNMPVNTVESLHIARVSEDVRAFADGLDFHQGSIKRIVFNGCRWIDADSE